MASYHSHQVQISTAAGLTEPINLTCKVLQGDTCAPNLFVLCLDYVLRQALPKEILRFMVLLTSQDKEADIQQSHSQTLTLLMTSPHSLSQSLGPRKFFWTLKAAIIGLTINVAKTEYITVGDWSDHSQADCVLRVTEGTVVPVDDFKYLGAWIMDSKKDFLARKALAWETALRMSKIWKSPLSRNLKLSFFRATVETVLLYGAVSWTLTKQLE